MNVVGAVDVEDIDVGGNQNSISGMPHCPRASTKSDMLVTTATYVSTVCELLVAAATSVSATIDMLMAAGFNSCNILRWHSKECS